MTEHYNLPVCSPVTGTIFFCLSVYLGKCDWQRILLGNPGCHDSCIEAVGSAV